MQKWIKARAIYGGGPFYWREFNCSISLVFLLSLFIAMVIEGKAAAGLQLREKEKRHGENDDYHDHRFYFEHRVGGDRRGPG
jgi:hypothetical protein